MKKNSKSLWYLITIVDPDCLPGTSIFNAIQLLLKVSDFKFVVMDYLYGAGISSLVEKENTILAVEEVMSKLCEVKQFDWGDFFLFKDYPQHWQNSRKLLYPPIIAQTDATVRAVDDGYIYIYTPDPEIANAVKENYEIESISIDDLENLSYPE